MEERIRNLKWHLKLWEEEYRCYGPQGTVKKRGTEITKADLNKIRRAIERIERVQAQALRFLQETERMMK